MESLRKATSSPDSYPYYFFFIRAKFDANNGSDSYRDQGEFDEV